MFSDFCASQTQPIHTVSQQRRHIYGTYIFCIFVHFNLTFRWTFSDLPGHDTALNQWSQHRKQPEGSTSAHSIAPSYSAQPVQAASKAATTSSSTCLGLAAHIQHTLRGALHSSCHTERSANLALGLRSQEEQKVDRPRIASVSPASADSETAKETLRQTDRQ